MRKIAVITTALWILLISMSSWALVQRRGDENTFDIATWNLREFPWRGQSTVDTVAILIRDLQLDLIALQEITDTIAFANLLTRLPGWSGLYAPSYPGDYIMKEAVIYRIDQVNILSWDTLFWNQTYEFPRPPLYTYVEANLPSGRFDFHLINLHLKAGNEPLDFSRRLSAMIRLKNYLDANAPNSPDRDWLIVGDYNDELTDPQLTNIFWAFLQDSLNYRFLTLPLAGNPYWASYPSYSSLIDHIMITTDALAEYGDSGQTITLRLDDEYRNYLYRVSDHRPVMSRFTEMQTGIRDDGVVVPPGYALATYPNPANAQVMVAACVPHGAQTQIVLYDCLGREQSILVDEHLEPGEYLFRLDASSLPSGVYFLRLAADNHRLVRKINLIK